MRAFYSYMGDRFFGIFCIISCILFSQGCSPQAELIKRYKSYQNESAPPNSPLIKVTLFSLSVKEEQAIKNITGLQDRGQAQLIKTLDTKTKDLKTFIAALGTPIKGESKEAPIVDKTIINRRLVFSLENASEHPADRITYAKFSLKIDPVNMGTFLNWDKFASKYETIDLGKMTFSKKQSFEGEISLAPPLLQPTVTGLNLKGSSERNLEEVLQLKERYVTSTGSLKKDEAVVLQEGALGIDLTGNLLIDIQIKTLPKNVEYSILTFQKLFKDDGTPNSPKEIGIREQTYKIPQTNAMPLKGKLSFKGITRQVVEGAETLIEGDDKVKFITTQLPEEEVILVDSDEMKAKGWKLTHADGRVLHLMNPGKVHPHIIFLDSLQEAEALLNWLSLSGGLDARGRKFQLGVDDLAASDSQNMSIQIQDLN